MRRLSLGFVAAALFSLPAAAGPAPDLKSLSVALPDAGTMLSGEGSDVANANCLGCHSVEMVLDQPALPRTVWEAEVAKMIKAYKAPIASQDVAAIVDYLARIKSAK